MNNSSSSHELTIVVNTCDTYRDVLDIFFHALSNYWPSCPYPVVINAESQTYNCPARVHNYHSATGADDWGDRVRSTLESIDTQFVLMVYDDFILDASVSNERIEAALQVLKSQAQAVVAYLIHTSIPLEPTTLASVFVPLKDRVNYRLNSSPAIWKTQALMSYTFAGDTPWAWEAFGTYRTWGDGNIFYSLNPNESDIYPYNHSKGGAIYRGRWVREVVESLPKKYALQINWSIRGFSSDVAYEKRSWIWKLKFMTTGFRMVGYKAIYFVTSYIRDKLHAQ
jgi:hypothetical protein